MPEMSRGGGEGGRWLVAKQWLTLHFNLLTQLITVMFVFLLKRPETRDRVATSRAPSKP